ncbi:hypothetical protein GOV05_03590, partial [Candidatus Woesearchaeota archaeon]|nr:hypothetical protein [Candidatus Woesearchaeota archaeon]
KPAETPAEEKPVEEEKPAETPAEEKPVAEVQPQTQPAVEETQPTVQEEQKSVLPAMNEKDPKKIIEKSNLQKLFCELHFDCTKKEFLIGMLFGLIIGIILFRIISLIAG